MYYYIINPAAGSARIQKVQDNLKRILGSFAISGEFTKTTGSGDIQKLTELATRSGFNTIVAVGGDGTLKEVINSSIGKEFAVGVIPLGRTNELAHVFGIPNWRDAGPILATRRILELPVIHTNKSSPMLHSLRAGLLRRVGPGNGRLEQLGKIKNLTSSVFQYKPTEISVRVDGNEINGEMTALRVTNGVFFRRLGMKIEFWGPLSPLEGLRLVLDNDHPQKTVVWGHRFELTSDEKLDVVIDGENAGEAPVLLEFREKQKLKVIVGRDRNF